MSLDAGKPQLKQTRMTFIQHIESLSYPEKLWYVASNPNAATFAYERLRMHRFAAVKQMARIWEANAVSKSSVVEPKPDSSQEDIAEYFRTSKESNIPLLYETHFYFVAWTDCRNMLKMLVGQPEFLEAKKVFDSYLKDYEHYANGRNSFEHFHDRLPGQRDEGRVREVREDPAAGPRRIFFGFGGGNYKHSDKLWDITPASLRLLEDSIDDVLGVVHNIIDKKIQSRFEVGTSE